MTTGANGSGGTTAADDTDERMAPPGALLAEEMRLLLDTLADRAQPWLNHLSGVDGTVGTEPHTPATCGWCPLCAGLAVLRGERPELAVRAAEHAAGLLSVLRSAVADHTPPPRPTPSPEHHWTGRDQSEAGPDRADQDQPQEPCRVQHITVRRRGEGDDHDGDGAC
jgi:hypothetical protein